MLQHAVPDGLEWKVVHRVVGPPGVPRPYHRLYGHERDGPLGQPRMHSKVHMQRGDDRANAPDSGLE